MSSKSGGTKVTYYSMSQWWGIAHTVDAVLQVKYGEKVFWSGRADASQSYSIDRKNLYGGNKKEGGVAGLMTVLLGDTDQVLPDGLAKRLGHSSGADVPGFRGVTSLFFTGHPRLNLPQVPIVPPGVHDLVPGYNGKPMVGPSYKAGNTGYSFYWTANSPYLKALAVTVERIPRQLDPLTASILREPVSFSYDGVWKYKVVAPADGGAAGVPSSYIAPSYDDSDWPQGPGGFGSESPSPEIAVRTYVAPEAKRGIWLRKKLQIEKPRNVGDLAIVVYHDDGAWLWWNGAPVAITPTSDYYIGTAVIPNSLIQQDNVIVLQVLDSVPDGSPANIFAGMSIIGDSGVRVDANPAHVVYECLTNTEWGLGEDPVNLDVDSFKTAAQTLFDERFGVSLVWDAASAIEDFVNNVLAHVNGVVYSNPRTGKLTMRLVREDYDVSTVREINPDNAMLTRFSRKAWGDTINEIQVAWTDPADEKSSKVVLQDDGNIAQQGSVNSSNSDYLGVRRVDLAWELAERDLRAASSPLCTGDATADRSFYDVVPMEVVKLNWPDYGVDAVYMRVGNVSYGGLGSSSITLSMSEDIFAYPKAVYTQSQSSEWAPPDPAAGEVSATYSMPAPYYGLAAVLGGNAPALDDASTYHAPLATSPAGDSSSYDLYVESTLPNGSQELLQVDDSRPFMSSAVLPAALPGAAISTIPGLSVIENDVILIGVPGLAAPDVEFALVASVDDAGVATVWRGVMDTTPKPWAAGASIWHGPTEGLSADPSSRLPGSTVKYRFVPSVSTSSTDGVTAPMVPSERAIFPYPPANLKIGTTDAFNVTSAAGAFVLSWAHRNKEIQAEQIMRQDEGSVTPTDTTRYALTVLDSADTILVARGDIAGGTATVDLNYTGPITLKLWAVDDNGLSYQAQVRKLNYTAGTATSNTITAPTYVPPDDSVIIDGGEIT